ncbi:HPr family phosphocarrier protein, partial [Stenotrophomonas maltophilia]|uniref:HPr family phosphocarrier protein n=1 Tax=Stenotrophomonas maltophilia TaxID=40324 RepID=UPI00313B31CF
MGLLARATAPLVQTVAPFRCKVTRAANGGYIKAMCILGVLRLAAGLGTPVTVRIKGEDYAAALEG